MVHIWVRAETKAMEHRAAVTPTTAKALIDAGKWYHLVRQNKIKKKNQKRTVAPRHHPPTHRPTDRPTSAFFSLSVQVLRSQWKDRPNASLMMRNTPCMFLCILLWWGLIPDSHI